MWPRLALKPAVQVRVILALNYSSPYLQPQMQKFRLSPRSARLGSFKDREQFYHILSTFEWLLGIHNQDEKTKMKKKRVLHHKIHLFIQQILAEEMFTRKTNQVLRTKEDKSSILLITGILVKTLFLCTYTITRGTHSLHDEFVSHHKISLSILSELK